MLVPNVGILFEAYVYLHGTERDRKLYDDLILESKTLDEQRRSLLLRRFAQPFAAYVASLALTRSRGRCKTPMFYISLVDDYFGLSNRGFVARAHCNMGLSLKSFRLLKKIKLETLKQETDEKMHKGLVVGGADNFNQKYWLTHVDVTKVPLVLANRAVGGLSILPRNLDFKAGGAILESLPRPSKLQKYTDYIIKAANRALVASREPGTELADWKFYNAAEVTTMGVYTVPARMPLNEFKARQLPDHHIGLRNFRPMFVANVNPGTLTGVYATFMRLFEIMEPQYNQGHYLPWKFDVAIYNNYLKV